MAPTRPRLVAALALSLALALAVGFVASCSSFALPASSPAPSDRTSAPGVASPGIPSAGLAPTGRLEEARVVRVVDGDTLIIDRGRGSERLRYIGVDAPESVKPDTPVEFMGHEALAANRALVAGGAVWLETDVSDRDRFDRLLRYVWTRDGDEWVMVNLELVREGYAQPSTFPPDVRWRDVFRDAERAARDAGVGLWGPVTPPP